MKHNGKLRRVLSLFLSLTMVLSLFVGLGMTVNAAAAPTLVLQVMDADGTTVAWSETWYFRLGTEENGWLDSYFSANSDGTGEKLGIVKDFTNYTGFEDIGALVYSGCRFNGGFPCLSVCKRGILLEDLIDYVENRSGYEDLRGETGIGMTSADGWKLPADPDDSTTADPVTDGKYNDFFWNGEVARYYYPGFYENSANFNPAADYVKAENGIRVPTVLSMVGYYVNKGGSSVEECLNTTDTDRSLRLFFGTSSTSSDDISDIKVNMGYYSGSNVDTISFYPVSAEEDTGWSMDADGNVTINGQAGMDNWCTTDRYGDTTVKTVTVTGNVTTIPAAAFKGLYALTTVTLPESVATIGDRAFCECKVLTGLTFLGTTPPTVENSILYSCPIGSMNIYVPAESVEAYKTALADTNGAARVQAIGGTEDLGYEIADGVLTISSQTGMNNWASADHSDDTITTAVVTGDVTAIPASGFKNMRGLTELTLPATVTSVGAKALGNTALKVVTFLGTTPPTFDSTVLYGSPVGTMKIYVPAESVEAYKTAMADTNGAPRVFAIGSDDQPLYEIKDGVLTINGQAGMNAFPSDYYLDTTIKTLVINGDDVTTIPAGVFNGLMGLTTATIPATVTNIGSGAFAECTALTSLTFLGETPPKISSNALEETNDALVIYVPAASVDAYKTAVGTAYADRVQAIGGSEPDTPSEPYEIKDGVLTINGQAGMNAFPSDYYLDTTIKTLVINGDDVTTIPAGVFNGLMGLTTATIPATVTNIGSGAFAECTALTSLTFLGETPPKISSNALEETNDALVIYVPAASVDAYKTAVGTAYADRVQAIGGTPVEGGYVIEGDTLTITGQDGMDKWSEVCDNYYLDKTIKTVVMQGDITTICTAAFNGMMGLTTVTVPASVTTVGSAAFAECEALTGLTFEGETAPKFSTSSLTDSCEEMKIYVPAESVDAYKTAVGTAYADRVQPIGGTPVEGGYVIEGDTLTITGQDGMDKWSEVCDNYYLDKTIKTVVMQGDITTICTAAFNGMMGLTTVTVPASVTTVGSAAFAECEALTGLTFEGETAPKFSTSSLTDSCEEMKIYVPAESVDAYKTAVGTAYADRVQAIGGHTHTIVTDPAVDATCTTPGKTEGSHCSTCEEIIVAQTEIPALGHDYVHGTCSRCSDQAYTAGKWDGTLDFTWYNEADPQTSYTIYTEAEWEALAWICSEHLSELATLGEGTYTNGNVTKVVGTVPTAQNTFAGVSFKLANNLDFAGVQAEDGTWSGPFNYYPIGSQTANDNGSANWYGCFYGSFDGQYHTVSNIYLNRGSNMSYQSGGLFGRVGSPDGVTPVPDNDIVIENFMVTGYIHSGRSVGGVVGKTLHVTSGHMITVRNCVNAAEISSTDSKGVGGIVGALWNTAEIRDCINLGSVTSGYRSACAGGIAGTNDGCNKIYNCLNVGKVSSKAANAYMGALVGNNDGTGLVVNSYYLEGCVDTSNGTRGMTDFGTAKTHAELIAPAMVELLGSAYQVTCGYPILSWQTATPHVSVDTEDVAATCTSTGHTGGTHCSVCGAVLTASTEVPMLPHSFTTEPVEATCLTGGAVKNTCSECGYVCYTDLTAANGHDVEIVAGTPATCDASGLTDGVRCKTCETWLVEQTTIDATGHTEVTDVLVAPTCTETGLTAGSHCATCGKTLSEQTVIPATGHTEVTDTGVAATCEATGLTDGSHCSVCGTVLTAQTVIPAKGHHYVDEPIAATCLNGGMIKHTCSDCGDVRYSDLTPAAGHDVEIVTGKAATCTETGLTDGVRCKTCKAWLVEQTEIAAKGHTEVKDAAVASTCTETGKTEGTHCSVCGTVLLAPAELEALGHSYAETARVNPTETEAGSVTYTCSRCNDSYTETLDKVACPSAAYTDVPAGGNWAHAGIDFCVAHNLMNGMSATRFDPQGTLTRAQLVTILYRAAGQPEVTASGTFSDLTANWYKTAVEWAAANGIVKGYTDGAFRPNNAITREQIATILYRFQKANKAEGDKLAAFPDAGEVSGWAAEGMNWAVSEGIINGVTSQGKTYLQPKATATRAQIAAIIMRALDE